MCEVPYYLLSLGKTWIITTAADIAKVLAKLSLLLLFFDYSAT